MTEKKAAPAKKAAPVVSRKHPEKTESRQEAHDKAKEKA